MRFVGVRSTSYSRCDTGHAVTFLTSQSHRLSTAVANCTAWWQLLGRLFHVCSRQRGLWD